MQMTIFVLISMTPSCVIDKNCYSSDLTCLSLMNDESSLSLKAVSICFYPSSTLSLSLKNLILFLLNIIIDRLEKKLDKRCNILSWIGGEQSTVHTSCHKCCTRNVMFQRCSRWVTFVINNIILFQFT